MRGPRLRFQGPGLAAVVGAGCVVHVNGREFVGNRSWQLAPGDELAVSAMAGARGYLAFAGGLLVDPFLGSASTDTVAGVGGLGGRSLRAGDRLELAWGGGKLQELRRLRPAVGPEAEGRIRLRFSDGPQAERLSALSWRTLLTSVYTVSAVSDRTAVRLEGPGVFAEPGAILSEGQPEGSIQLPAQGRPLVLLAGRRTVGGYPKFGVAGRRAVWTLAQALPGTEVVFERVSVKELRAERARWDELLTDPDWLCEPLPG